MMVGNSKNLRVYDFVIVLELRKFDAHEIYMLTVSNVTQYML